MRIYGLVYRQGQKDFGNVRTEKKRPGKGLLESIKDKIVAKHCPKMVSKQIPSLAEVMSWYYCASTNDVCRPVTRTLVMWKCFWPFSKNFQKNIAKNGPQWHNSARKAKKLEKKISKFLGKSQKIKFFAWLVPFFI